MITSILVKYPTHCHLLSLHYITGASAGIGEMCAWRFAEEGCKLILIARRQERLSRLSEAIQSQYPDLSIHTITMDVQDLSTVASIPSSLPQQFKDVYLLINNAGLALGIDPIHQLDMLEAKQMIDTNILSLIAFSRAFIPGMVERNQGHIINMSSIAGHEKYSGGSVYCATKHAVDAITGAARHDLVDTDIRISALSPGAVKTEFSMVRFKGDVDKADSVYAGFDPLTAADIAEDAVWVATRPLHVQVAEVVTLANAQCSAKGLSRKL
jgi:NADP-dependent 3-hydroxy acid dehydrogenase YdfG